VVCVRSFVAVGEKTPPLPRSHRQAELREGNSIIVPTRYGSLMPDFLIKSSATRRVDCRDRYSFRSKTSGIIISGILYTPLFWHSILAASMMARTLHLEVRIKLPYLVGTMIELPRAALLADEIAEVAEFFLLRHERPDADHHGPFA